ncbi:MAG TPA: hypothetical protein VM370_10290 [Candidatus Thermoplasmatota archaeon]|nr:hypothetical protein [Candidatus Thermoplasmatota archaeon]
MKPGTEALVDHAARIVPRDARVLDLGGPAIPSPRLASRRVIVVPDEEALPALRAHASAPVDAVLAAWPTQATPLMPLLDGIRRALAPQGRALVLDLSWQTAPTPALLQAFAPGAGREKVRPIEGYEMQMEHAGLEIVERVVLDRAHWASRLAPSQRAAVEGDERGAARLTLWVLAPASSDDRATTHAAPGGDA